MWGRGKGIRLRSMEEGPRIVRCPWAPNVLATPLDDFSLAFVQSRLPPSEVARESQEKVSS